MRRVALALGAVIAGGCVTHVPPAITSRYNEVAWEADLASAKVKAAATNRPILLMLVAGKLTGFS